MSDFVFLAVFGALVWIATRLLLRAWSVLRSDKAQPAATSCPRCAHTVSLSDLACSNCGRKGSIRRQVIRLNGAANNYFTCENCRTPSISLVCPHCQTDLRGLFSAQ